MSNDSFVLTATEQVKESIAMSQEKLGSVSVITVLDLVIKYGPSIAVLVKKLIDLLPKQDAKLMGSEEVCEAIRVTKVIAIIKFVNKYAEQDTAMFNDLIAVIKNPSVEVVSAFTVKYQDVVVAEVNDLIALFKQ